LYVGYYGSQKTGDTIHSPKNCLPGSGWDPVRSGFAAISVAEGRQIVVNEYVIQQDENKQLVFYWYQGRGRVIASEYAGKFWMVADAISRNRTDGALVRLVTPINDNEASARARLVRFTQDLFPQLDEIIPK
jgi:EpsI family protein